MQKDRRSKSFRAIQMRFQTTRTPRLLHSCYSICRGKFLLEIIAFFFFRRAPMTYMNRRTTSSTCARYKLSHFPNVQMSSADSVSESRARFKGEGQFRPFEIRRAWKFAYAWRIRLGKDYNMYISGAARRILWLYISMRSRGVARQG